MEFTCDQDKKTFMKEGQEHLAKKYFDHLADKKEKESFNIEKRHLESFR